MKEFDYELDYKRLDFTDEETRKLYRIGRGEQGVLLVRPYTDNICAHWRFKTPEIAVESANHNSGRKYKKGTKEVLPQEADNLSSKYAESARVFKKVRDIVAKNETYVKMRKQWRSEE